MLEGEVFAAEDVAFAGASDVGVEGVGVGAGDFGDVDEVEAGVDVGGEFFVEEVDDDAAGWRGFDVGGADGGGGVEDDDGLAGTRGFYGDLFSEEFSCLLYTSRCV